MPIKTPIENKPVKEIIAKTRDRKPADKMANFKWWNAQNDKQLCDELLSTAKYLKNMHQVRIRQASMYTRLFSGKPLYNYMSNVGTLDNSQQLPIGRPTSNVCYTCCDTIVSQLTQNKPRPVFLTDDGHYKERHIAETMNNFIMGEFFRLKTYAHGANVLRDSSVIGDGILKVFPKDGKVCHERTIATELLVDFNDAYYGNPRSLIQFKLVDREEMIKLNPKQEEMILRAGSGTVDTTPMSTDTVTDQLIVAEGWHLPSGRDTKDGRHAMVCSAGLIEDEEWKYDHFPFAKLGYNPQLVGWFSQSLCEILMPTQMEIYKLLIVASQAIELMGVPRILINDMASILETAFNNNIGSIIKWKGVQPPQFINAQANHPEIYQWIKWLIENAHNMAGMSMLATSSQKPAGLNSGEAQRVFLDNQAARFSNLQTRYQSFYTDVAYLTIECASEIAKETGEYLTVYPGKDGTREVDLPEAVVLRDTYVIQCYEESALPRDPAGRQAKLSEMLAAGEITKQEFRRLSALPDLQQSDSLANALEERILKSLDEIVEKGRKRYKAPDPFILDPSDLASQLAVQYINKYEITDIEPEKLDMLREWWTQVQALKAQAMPPMPQQVPGAPAQALPQGQQAQLPVAPPQASVAPTSNVRV